MIRKGRVRAAWSAACGLGLGAILFVSCADAGIPLKDLRGKIQAGSKRNAELVFAAKDAVVALIDNHRGVLYAGTSIGDIYKITGVNKAERIYRGLASCTDRWTGFAVDREGKLIVNTCRDRRDVLVSINEKGEMHELFPVDDRVLSLASDQRGRLYIAVWTSEGNVSISLNPRALAGAEFINGKIYMKEQDGPLTAIYNGAIPVWTAVSGRNILYAALWGQKGYFAPEKKTYGFVDPYRAYWLALSDKVSLMNLTDGKIRFENSLIDSLTLFLIPDDDYLFGYGISKEGEGGFFLVEENRPPIKLLLQDQALDKNITAMALFNGVVYFGNVNGNIYRIK